MSESERLVKFSLLGQDFAFYTAASEEEMTEILELVEQQVDVGNDEVGKTIPVTKLAVMACLNLASRYVRMKKEFDDYRLGSEARINILCEKIEHHFSLEK